MGSMYMTAQDQIVEIANSAYYMDVPVQTLEELSVRNLLENSGYVINSDGTAVYMGSIPSSSAVGSEVIGNTAVNSKVVTVGDTKTLKTTEIPAGTTTQGTNLLKGAANIQVSPVMSALMIAQACGYMWNEVEEHPEFWTDMSDALLGLDQGGIVGNVTPEALKLKNGLNVLLRARQDGGIGAYCEKEKIQRTVNAMYEAGAFQTEADLQSEITSSGTYIASPGGASLSEAFGVFGVPQPLPSVFERFEAHFNERVHNQNINAMVVGCWVSTWDHDGFVDFAIDGYDIEPNTNITCTLSGSNITTSASIPTHKMSFLYRYNFYTGEFIGQSAGYTRLLGNVIQGTSGNYSVKSTVNSVYIPGTDYLEVDDTPGTIVITGPAQLETLLQDWMNDGFTTDRVNPTTGENEQVEWLPLNIFDFFRNPSPTPGGQPYAQSGELPGVGGDPSIFPDFLIDYLVPNINFPNFQFPENPTGSTPTPFVPSNSMSSKLYTVYNPSNANLDSLGAYMWNTSIIQQLVELFTNNPMDAIISLHQIYATPTTGSNKNIILGVLDSGVSSPIVTNQYVVIDCGTVSIPEIYGDARDYTQVETDIFLPFIGLRSLDCHDVIGCDVNVKFKVDVYTGSTLAEISVTKQGVTQILYTFEGNCSVQIPLTAADRSRMIQGIVAATTGLVTGGVGAMAGAAAAASVGGAMQTSIQKSSAFSGNAGAMGGKTPYIVITRQKSADASNFPEVIGYPTNKGVYLKDCKGFTKVKDIHIDIASATEYELDLLYRTLKEGIVI